MASTLKLSKLAALIAAATTILAAPGVAQADGVAQSLLSLSGFTIRVANGDASVSPGIIPALPGGTASNTGDVFADLNGVVLTQSQVPTPGGFTISRCVGSVAACALYNGSIGTAVTGAPTATYTGSTSMLGGSALAAGGASAMTDNTVSLFPNGDGTAQGNVNLNSEFTLTVAQSVALEFNFNADVFLRAYLTDPGLATAGYNWSISINKELVPGVFTEVFGWNPNGLAGGISGGTEYLDPFSLNQTISTLSPADVQFDADTFFGANRFHAESNTLGAGKYKLTINHIARADANLIPEPGVLSLAGLALFGAYAATRRRRAGKAA